MSPEQPSSAKKAKVEKKPAKEPEEVNPAKFQEILEEQDEEDQEKFNPDDMPDVSCRPNWPVTLNPVGGGGNLVQKILRECAANMGSKISLLVYECPL